MVMLNCFKYPDSNIKLQQRNIRIILDKLDLGTGTLIISERSLCWQDTNELYGFSIDYPDISLHGISKDENLYQAECIIILLDGRIRMPNKNGLESQNSRENENSDGLLSDGESEEEEEEVSQIILFPEREDSSIIATIYEAIKVCQELNPDPDDMMDNDDSENNEDDDYLYVDAEDEVEEENQMNNDRRAGDGDIDIMNDLAQRLEENHVDRNGLQNGNEDEEFVDAD